jgi:hypothetical protein
MRDPKLPLNTNFCKCSSCGEYFGGAAGFDRHRVDHACIPPSAVIDKHGKQELKLNERGYWVRTYG